MYHEINITTYDRFCVSAYQQQIVAQSVKIEKTAPDFGNCI